MRSSISKKMEQLYRLVDCLAKSNSNILITGESGTGKELLAKHIHSTSARAERDFVSINCAAVPEELLESEFFGHKRGSYTGAHCDKIGLFELADGGTIFLDEIGDMPLSLQAKLLRVLQERKIRPLGGVSEKTVDFRLISATHRDLKHEIEKGRFREDLFYRVNVIPLVLPPLRERREDIPNLVSKFLIHFGKKYEVDALEFSNAAIEELCSRQWPGNIRELENLVEQMVVLNSTKECICVEDLPSEQSSFRDSEIVVAFKNLKTLPSVTELTTEYINFVIKEVNLHQGDASKILGISRRTLYRKLKIDYTDPHP